MRRFTAMFALAGLMLLGWDASSAFARRRCCYCEPTNCCAPAAVSCTAPAPATAPTPAPEPPKSGPSKSPSDITNVPPPPTPKPAPAPAPAPPKITPPPVAPPPAPKAVTPPSPPPAPPKTTTPPPASTPPAPPKTTPPDSKSASPPDSKSASLPKTNSATSAAPKAAEKWTSLFDGKTLGQWKVTDFGTQGPVEVKDGNLLLGFGDGCTGVTWSGDFPKLDYEIRLEAKRVEGTDFFCGLTFPVGDDNLTFVVGGWGGAVVGISCIDGEDASENDTTKVMDFDKGRWYKIRVRVTKPLLSCWIDKEQVVDEPLTDRKLSLRSEVEQSKPVGIASWKTTAAIRNVQWRKLTAAELK